MVLGEFVFLRGLSAEEGPEYLLSAFGEENGEPGASDQTTATAQTQITSHTRKRVCGC